MSIKLIDKFTAAYNQLASHPLQSWEWGEFRKKTALRVFRFGEYKDNKLTSVFQITLHPIPKTPYCVGYIPKSNLPSKQLLTYLKDFAQQHKIIFIKFEPNVEQKTNNKKQITKKIQIGKFILLMSPRPLFTKYTFQIDLTKSEEELLAQMKSKTRYNIRLAQKKGVKVFEDNSDKSFSTYLKLQKETWKRQKFYAHNEKYHRLLWESLYPKGTAHILNATYHNEVLVSWMVFLFNDVLYYPYGGSSEKYRNFMPSNLMLWEAMKWGKAREAKTFDLWGSLGPNPDQSDPWYGFHRFKEGYGGRLVEFIGSYDFVVNPFLYSIYNIVDNIRWKILNSYR